ncbi:MAG: 6-carboxytetrahydropterin synthase QueD [Clostridia bacterium]|nr:6-carboxytetrahydropterin synthase QueD [Clostridia bacterium]
MYILETSAAFDSAHFLSGYNGKCANLHGHHWVIKVTAAAENIAESGEKRGMLIDFGDMKKIVRGLADRYDHALLYEKNSLKQKTIDALNAEGFLLIELSYRPTAENFAKAFFDELKENGLPVARVTVYETPDNCAAYSEE